MNKTKKIGIVAIANIYVQILLTETRLQQWNGNEPESQFIVHTKAEESMVKTQCFISSQEKFVFLTNLNCLS